MAVIVFSSGTTGVSKGIIHTHRTLLRHIAHLHEVARTFGRRLRHFLATHSSGCILWPSLFRPDQSGRASAVRCQRAGLDCLTVFPRRRWRSDPGVYPLYAPRILWPRCLNPIRFEHVRLLQLGGDAVLHGRCSRRFSAILARTSGSASYWPPPKSMGSAEFLLDWVDAVGKWAGARWLCHRRQGSEYHR